MRRTGGGSPSGGHARAWAGNIQGPSHDRPLPSGNVKSRPVFARDPAASKAKIKDFFIKEGKSPQYLTDYKGYDSRQISKMAHVEAMADGTLVLFDHRNRDPLTYNARACVIDMDDNG